MRLYAVAGTFMMLLFLCTPCASAPIEGGGRELEGMIEPNEVVEIASAIPGLIDVIAVERGDRVEKGALLARLHSGVEEAAVNLALARVDFGKRKSERNEQLYQKKLISLHEKDELETELRLSELQLQEATERLKLRTIESPITGVVVERTLSPGEYVGEGSILTLASIDPLYVEVVASVNLLGTIRKGMTADVYPDASVGGTWRAKVIVVDQVVDAASGTFGVRLELPNPDGKLPAGLKCRVAFGGK